MSHSFSLQSILSYRKRVADTLELALGRLLTDEHAASQYLVTLGANEQALHTALARQQRGVLDLVAIEHMRGQLRGVQAEMKVVTRRLAELREQVVEKREELVTARRAKETLEKLKEREKQHWLAEENRRESADRDDLYIARAHRLAGAPPEA